MIIGILATGLLAHALLQRDFLNSVENRLLSNAYLIRGFLLDDVHDIDDIRRVVARESDNFKARVTVIDSNGVVVVDSEANLHELDNHGNRPEVIMAVDGLVGVSQRYSKSINMDLYYVAIPYDLKSGGRYVIRLSVPLTEISTFNYHLFRTILLSAAFGLVVAMLLGVRFLKVIINPIQDMSRASKEIANGKFGRSIIYDSDDELGELAENFNKMSEELGNKIMEIKDQNIKNSAILSSMINGVIAVDNQKHVMFINPAAELLFGFREDEIKGRHILEAFRNNQLDEQIQALIDDNVQSAIEIEMHRPEHRILNMYSNPIVSSQRANERIGVVIIIADVTDMRKLEFMRKDFVANVSHELKTPLTSIRGFVETLKNGAVDNVAVRDKFLDIIDMETGRLSTLIEDLLVLSDIEKRSNMIEKSQIDVCKAAEEVVHMLQEIGKKKNVAINLNCDKVNTELFGNSGWFKQMLINLIDNGIKYTPNDGSVWVNMSQTGDDLLISIKDNGIGIPEEHIDRLFERFYRVDKARSRNVGGTGLGLAIVKHVVLSFGGHIDVRSEYGKGTEFIVRIPFEV
ncbi:two-component system histidine kinase PnpS [Fusibacter sp. JL216-2]|uniref:two-component system histidine kinase PnpS n=1 Tax=Fusibacter sp. JL216-2 TaxID=3071453 RepID=UPI003D3491B6